MNKALTADYDLLIVGASFAGLVAARTAAHRGLKVAVIDAKTEPGARVRTTGVLVKEAVDDTDIPSTLTRKIRGARLYAPNGRHVDLTAPGYYFLATDTPAIMRWLAREAARAGAELLYGVRFEDAGVDGDLVRVGKLGLSARYLLGADGAKSRVAAVFGLGRNKEFLLGVETEYEETPTVDPDFIHCFIDSRLAPGYLGWVVPGVDMTQVGLAVAPGPSGRRKPDHARFLQRIDTRFAFWNCEMKQRRSGPIPCGGLVSPLAGRRVLLTGGGIRLAFQYGRRAGAAIANYLEDGGPDPGLVMARDYPHFAVKTWMRRLWSLAPPNALLNAWLFTPPMQALARWIYFQKRVSTSNNRRRFVKLESKFIL